MRSFKSLHIIRSRFDEIKRKKILNFAPNSLAKQQTNHESRQSVELFKLSNINMLAKDWSQSVVAAKAVLMI